MTLTCREFADFLMAYLDGELPADEHAEFQRHMGMCPPCVDYVETYRETVRLGRLCCDPEGPVPADAPERLIQAILAARATR